METKGNEIRTASVKGVDDVLSAIAPLEPQEMVQCLITALGNTIVYVAKSRKAAEAMARISTMGVEDIIDRSFNGHNVI